MRRWGDHGRRLSAADHLEIQRRVSAGETFASAAAAVGCSPKSIQRFIASTGGFKPKCESARPGDSRLASVRSSRGGCSRAIRFAR